MYFLMVNHKSQYITNLFPHFQMDYGSNKKLTQRKFLLFNVTRCDRQDTVCRFLRVIRMRCGNFACAEDLRNGTNRNGS